MSADDLLRGYAAGRRDFHGVDLRRQCLDAQELAGIDLQGADIRGCSFRRAVLTSACFRQVKGGAPVTIPTLAIKLATSAIILFVFFVNGWLFVALVCLFQFLEHRSDRPSWEQFCRFLGLRPTDFSGALLTGADFAQAELGETVLDAHLKDTRFLGASLDAVDFGFTSLQDPLVRHLLVTGEGEGLPLDKENLAGLHLAQACLMDASFCGANLEGVNLARANLMGAQLGGANLQAADLHDARLSGADLGLANLAGANLHNVDLTEVTLRGAAIDVLTYHLSAWTPMILAGLLEQGVEVLMPDCFPDDARAVLRSPGEGLSLWFNTKISPVDRLLVDGVIFAVLGDKSDCRVIEFRERKETAIIRLQATSRADLEDVAEALYRRVWERPRAHEQSLAPVTQLLGPRALDLLSDLRQRIDRLELNLDKRRSWSWNLGHDSIEHTSAVNLFLCYAPEDDSLREQMERHLITLTRQGLLKTWHTGMLHGGDIRDSRVHEQLAAADVVVVLVSADLLAVDALHEDLQRALVRHDAGLTRLIPVLVRSVDITGTALARLTALPEGNLPVTRWADRDDAWQNVASGIRRIVLGIIDERGQSLPPAVVK